MVIPKQMRKIGTTRRSVSGLYAFRGHVAVPFESTLERDFLIRAEYSLQVEDVVPQPVQIPFTAGNGRSLLYTPDFLVRYVGGVLPPLLVEVKPEDQWRKHWRNWAQKWKAARRFALEQGWRFRVHDESRIRDQALRNIRFLEPYKRIYYPDAQHEWVIDRIRAAGKFRFEDVLYNCFSQIGHAEGTARLWHLVATRQLDCDISSPLAACRT